MYILRSALHVHWSAQERRCLWRRKRCNSGVLHRTFSGAADSSKHVKQCHSRCLHDQLQEIYGMDQAGGAAAKAELTEAEAEDRLCVICLVNERDTTVLPCRHMCMCHGAPLAPPPPPPVQTRSLRFGGARCNWLNLLLMF